MKWLTLDDIELIHMQIIDASGGQQGARDSDRIESALAAMRQEVFGEPLYPSIYDKAAVLLRSLIVDRPFQDGNKRTAVISVLVLLNLNGHDTSSLKDKDLKDLAIDIAAEHLEIPVIAAWLRAHCKSGTING